jgi:transposase
MPLASSILNLNGYEIEKISGICPVIIKARYIQKVICPFCKNDRLRKKHKYTRKLHHESIGDRTTILLLAAYKHRCLRCGRYFNQRFPGILKYKRSTEGFRREVF